MKTNRLICAAVMAAAFGFGARSGYGQQAPVTSERADSLRVGDVLRLWIWREPELSGEFLVPENGVVVLPKLGTWKVKGRRPVELRSELITEYQKYLRNPSIEVTFLRRVNVLGSVKHPGVYPLDETMSIANALALAGGPEPEGKPNEVELYRDGKKLITRITQQTRITDLPIQSGDQLFVPERSWAARNTPILAAMVSGLVSVAIALIVQK